MDDFLLYLWNYNAITSDQLDDLIDFVFANTGGWESAKESARKFLDEANLHGKALSKGSAKKMAKRVFFDVLPGAPVLMRSTFFISIRIIGKIFCALWKSSGLDAISTLLYHILRLDREEGNRVFFSLSSQRMEFFFEDLLECPDIGIKDLNDFAFVFLFNVDQYEILEKEHPGANIISTFKTGIEKAVVFPEETNYGISANVVLSDVNEIHSMVGRIKTILQDLLEHPTSVEKIFAEATLFNDRSHPNERNPILPGLLIFGILRSDLTRKEKVTRDLLNALYENGYLINEGHIEQVQEAILRIDPQINAITKTINDLLEST